MTTQEDALARVTAFLERVDVPYMVIDGIANLVWGEARATVDIDITVLVPPDDVQDFIDAVSHEYQMLVEAPWRFVTDTRVLPVSDPSGVRIDLVFGLLPFEEEAVRRAASVHAAGRSIRVCTPEDLILMKIISERPRDLEAGRSSVPSLTDMDAMLTHRGAVTEIRRFARSILRS